MDFDALRQNVWTILHEECGAGDEMPLDFAPWPQRGGEYRFIGALGFGGKVWSYRYADLGLRLYVTAYPEDMTPERQAMIDKANQRLKLPSKEA